MICPAVGEPDWNDGVDLGPEAQPLLVRGRARRCPRRSWCRAPSAPPGRPTASGAARPSRSGRWIVGRDRERALDRCLVHRLGELDLERRVERQAGLRRDGRPPGARVARRWASTRPRPACSGRARAGAWPPWRRRRPPGRPGGRPLDRIRGAPTERQWRAWPSWRPLLSARLSLPGWLESRLQHGPEARLPPIPKRAGTAGGQVAPAERSRRPTKASSPYRSRLAGLAPDHGRAGRLGCSGRTSRPRGRAIRAASGRRARRPGQPGARGKLVGSDRAAGAAARPRAARPGRAKRERLPRRRGSGRGGAAAIASARLSGWRRRAGP